MNKYTVISTLQPVALTLPTEIMFARKNNISEINNKSNLLSILLIVVPIVVMVFVVVKMMNDTKNLNKVHDASEKV